MIRIEDNKSKNRWALGLRSFWNWFGFLFIVAPLGITWSVMGLVVLLTPFAILALALGWVFGENPSNPFLMVLAVVGAGFYYFSPSKGQDIFISWVNPESKMELISKIIGVKISK